MLFKNIYQKKDIWESPKSLDLYNIFWNSEKPERKWGERGYQIGLGCNNLKVPLNVGECLYKEHHNWVQTKVLNIIYVTFVWI